MGTALGVEQRRRGGEAGFTLVEIVIVVAIVVTTALAGVAISLGSRSFAVATAASEFDHIVDSARTIARETQGATLLFAPDVFGDGTEVRVVTPGPNGTLSPTTVPTLHTRAAIEESESLGKAPFAFVVHATGALGGRPGYRTGPPNSIPEVGCPPTGWFHFLIHAAGATAERTLPCRITLAATGPVTLATWPPAPMAPPPTPCTSALCTPNALPTPPSSSPTCPPSFAPISAGCTPSAASGAAPHYHVTATLISPAITVGDTDGINVQATLTNASSVSPGTPTAVPVQLSVNNSVCLSTPSGSQPSGTVFVISGLAIGVCQILVQADVSGVIGATSDQALVSIPVTNVGSTPEPRLCDLTESGKCYTRIAARTSFTFWKYVDPDVSCNNTDGASSCSYVNSIKQIYLAPGFGVLAPLPPIDTAHELLFKIEAIDGVHMQCQPFDFISGIPGGGAIPWGGSGVGGPVDPQEGLGEPSVYATLNHLIIDPYATGVYDLPSNWGKTTTLSGMYNAVALRSVSAALSFTYSSASATIDKYVQWHPDFPGCDAVTDIADPNRSQFGPTGVSLVFEIFQATP